MGGHLGAVLEITGQIRQETAQHLKTAIAGTVETLGRISLAGLPVGEWRYLLGYERF